MDFVKIVDFGIAKDLGLSLPLGDLQEAVTGRTVAEALSRHPALSAHSVRLEAMVGTPLYMAPEQVRGRKLDARCDQYALGCILYQLLTERPPFQGETPMETIFMRLLSEALPPRQVAPARRISAELEAICMRCLAVDPAHRFASMDELASQLEHEAETLAAERRRMQVAATAARPSVSAAMLPLPPPQGAAARTLAWLRQPGSRARVAIVATPLALLLVGMIWLVVRVRLFHISSEDLLELDQRAVAILLGALAESDADTRVRALVGLAETHDIKLRGKIEPALSASNEEVAAQAASTLGAIGATTAVTRLADLFLSSPLPRVRLAAAHALQQLADARGTRYLREALAGRDEEIRVRAGYLLCEHADPAGVSFMQSLVDAGTLPPPLLVNTLTCLAGAGDGSAKQRLVELMTATASGSSAREVKLGAAARLAQLGDVRGRELLESVAAKAGAEQVLAARLLASSTTDDPQSATVLRAIVRRSQLTPDTLLVAVEGLGYSGQPDDALLLKTWLTSQTPLKLRLAAASAIVQIAHRDSSLLAAVSADWARAGLSDANWMVRSSAATVLGDSPAADALALLGRVIKDSETGVRKSGARALGRRLERDALLALRDTLSDADVDVRREALSSLVRIAAILPAGERAEVARQVGSWLAPLVVNGSRPEQVLARGVLLRLGEAAQADKLRALANGAPEDLRVLVIQQLEDQPRELATFLGDSALAVRLTAARLLARHGDRRGMSVLSEGLAQGGTLAQLAIGAIGRLGGNVRIGKEATTLLSRGTLEERLTIVEAWAALPAAQAGVLLDRAARNGDVAVRMQVVEALADLLRSSDSALSAAWLATMRGLARDADAAVRARAGAVLARALVRAREQHLEPGSAAPRGGSSAAPGPVAAIDEDTEVDSKSATSEETPSRGGRGSLVVKSARPVLYQLDSRAWQHTDGKPVSLDAGSHRLIVLGSTQSVEIHAAQTTTVQLEESPAEEAERRGQEALSAKDYRKAQKLFDKARASCAKAVGYAAGCAVLGFDIAVKLGQVYEAQSRWAAAMLEYQTATQLAPQIRGQKDAKTMLQSAIARLSPLLGRVVLPKQVDGKCREQAVWLPTGTHTLLVGGASRTITVSPGETVHVGSCN